MSPTSYQAAPPRETIIANGHRAVKRIRPIARPGELIYGVVHELYGVFVNGETSLEPEWTLQMPVEV